MTLSNESIIAGRELSIVASHRVYKSMNNYARLYTVLNLGLQTTRIISYVCDQNLSDTITGAYYATCYISNAHGKAVAEMKMGQSRMDGPSIQVTVVIVG